MGKRALITGVDGQDGTYLSELLLSKGYEVHGLIRRSSNHKENHKYLKDVVLHYGDICTENHLCYLINDLKPDELYNLAAQSDVAVSFQIPEYTGEATGLSVTRILEAIRYFSPNTKFYQASTSELFGNIPGPQNEDTRMIPSSPYAAAKHYAYEMTRIYRWSYGIFTCNGILMNHESPRRGLNFVTRKVTHFVANMKPMDRLHLGSLDAKRDWGYAPEYCESMWLMLQQEKPDDYVIGTGETHTIRELLFEAFSQVGLDCHDYVEIDQKFVRPLDVFELRADASKARKILNWKPKVTFKELIRIMVQSDLMEAQK
jgi:GDPmannose 4,6-dehydratase